MRHELVQNILSLYGVQVANYIVPLVTIPYLARVLGAAGWGLVAFAQAFGSYVVLIGDFGFSYSATREVARHREDREKVSHVLTGVMGAKGVLATTAAVVAFLVRGWIPLLRDHPSLFWWAMFWATAQAANMRWFFRGLERMRLLAAIETSARFLALIGILVFVRRPGDEWRVFAVQGLGFLLSLTVCLVLAYREFPFRLPTWTSVLWALRMGRGLFLFESSISLYTAANTLVLGLLVPPQIVGFYAGAEKIARAASRLLDPVTQALYPRLSHLIWQAPRQAARLAKTGTAFAVSAGAAFAALIYFLAPELIRVLLGSGYDGAVPVLRILALFPLFTAWATAFAMQWAIPLGLERGVNAVMIVAGLVNLGLAVLLGREFAAVGMAWVVVMTEILVASGIYFVVRQHRPEPVSGSFGAR